MSTSIAIAAVATAQAAAAQAAAMAARRTACTGYVNGYHAESATVVEMREYASCVDVLHPQPIAGPDLLLMKIAVGIILGSIVIGAFFSHFTKRSWDEWWETYLCFPLLVWGGGSFILITVLALIGLGIRFLFTT